jgi:hypothetical protein
VDVGQWCAEAVGLLESHSGNPPHLHVAVGAIVGGAAHSGFRTFDLVAEVDAADQFADHQDIDSVADHLGFEGGEGRQAAGQAHRPVVGKGVVAFAQREDRAEFRAVLLGNGVHLLDRQTHRPLDDHVGRVAGHAGFFGKGLPSEK